MENNRMFPLFASVLMCLFFSGCATTQEPRGWLPDDTKVPTDPYGAWMEANTNAGPVMGELIAVSLDTVFIANTSLHGINKAEIQSARLSLYNAGDLWAAPLLGPLLTISNGWFLVFTAPMWIIGGSIAASSRSYEPIIDYPAKPLHEFVRYARFPQGLPADLDRSTITMKQVKKE